MSSANSEESARTVVVNGNSLGTAWYVKWIVVPLLILNLILAVLMLRGVEMEEENGPMENAQATFLLVGVGFLVAAAKRNQTGVRVLCAGLALFVFNMAVREVDVRPFNIPWLTRILSGWGRDSWLGVLWLIAAIWFFRHRQSTWSAFLRWLKTPAGRLMLIAAVPVVVAEFPDKLHPFASKSLNDFVEEILEFDGYWLVLLSGLLTYRFFKSEPLPPPKN